MVNPSERLASLQRFYQKQQRLPSYSELMTLFKLRSKNAVHRIMQQWLVDNVVERTTNGKYAPGIKLRSVPILGSISAGFPSPAEEELADAITLDDYLIKNRAASFMVKVSGDSMIDAGIHPGDLVVVERGHNPKSGDIVVAHIDGAFTLKRFYQKNKQVWLKAENKNYPTFYPTEELKIEGVVTGVIRKYT